MPDLRHLALVIIIALVLPACGGSDSTTPSAAPAPQPAPSPAPQQTPESTLEPSLDCIAVNATMAEAILTGATASGMTEVRASAVRSPDFERVYFIAVEFALAGAENVVGVWASNSLEPGGGIIFAADVFAKEFSDWGDAETTDAAISPADSSIRRARECAAAAAPY